MPIATLSDLGTGIGVGAWMISVLLLLLSLPTLLIAMILRISSRRFTHLVYGPALRFAFLSIVTDLFGTIVGYAFQPHVIFGWVWHVGQSGFALLIAAIAFVLLRREPDPSRNDPS